jgi:hypothetical protein
MRPKLRVLWQRLPVRAVSPEVFAPYLGRQRLETSAQIMVAMLYMY